ncbi:MAG: hypothetical protein IJX78_02280 [Bacilli bacterium]|nr:hypothetical protein [Bacilli bacterium]
MKFIEKLNNTGKILFLILTVIVLSGILVLAGSLNKDVSAYENYSTIPGDENMDIALRVKERRTFPTTSTDKEMQYWDLQVYLHLKDQKAIYRNATVYVALLKNDGTIKYEEKSANILTGIENPSNVTGSTSDRSIFSSYSITSKTLTYSSTTEEYVKKDGAPDKVYVKVVYEIRKENQDNEVKTITYQCDLINSDEIDFTKAEATSVKEGTTFLDLKIPSEVLKVKVRTELSSLASKSDTYRLNIEYNPITEDGTNSMKDGVVALFLGMKNTESDTDEFFSNYIEFAAYYGAIPYLYTIPQVATEYNGSFEIDNLYVYTLLNKADGTTETSNIYIPVEELPAY